jgi:hypothetical protein
LYLHQAVPNPAAKEMVQMMKISKLKSIIVSFPFFPAAG